MASFINIHTHNATSSVEGLTNFRLGVDAVAPQSPFSAGIHPWDAELTLHEQGSLLSRLSQMECVAIGEIGLDRVCGASFDVQRELFEAQLIIAANRQLPVVIHSVKTTKECLSALTKHNIKRAVFHGFIGSWEVAEEIIRSGYYISFGFGTLRSPKTIEALRRTPLDCLFLESDTQPRPIEELYSAVAEIKQIDTEKLKTSIYDNYTTLFR